jgi:hypothetical protein
MEGIFELGKVVLSVQLSKRGSPKLLRKLGAGESETVLLQKIGKYWNQMNRWDRPDGLVVVTSHRFVFLTKVETMTTTTDFLSFPLEMIEGWEETTVWKITPAVRFRVEGKLYMFTLTMKSSEVTAAAKKTGKLKI